MLRFKRIKNLDFLRGGLILLMLIEHFVGLISNLHQDPVFFEYLFSVLEKVNPTYDFSAPLPYDEVIAKIAGVTVFWVTNCFLMLSAFNLGLKINEFKWSFKKHLKKLIIVFSLVTLEEYIVQLPWSPVQLWCICLFFLSISYNYKKMAGLIGSVILVMSLYFIPNHDFIINYFYLSGFFGLIAGILFKSGKYNYLISVKVITITVGITLLVGTLASPVELDSHDIYLSGINYCKNPINLLFVNSLCICVLLIALFLDKKNLNLDFKKTNFISANSLSIYLTHKIAVMYFFIPFLRWIIINFNLNPLVLTRWFTIFICIVIYLILFKYASFLWFRLSSVRPMATTHSFVFSRHFNKSGPALKILVSKKSLCRGKKITPPEKPFNS